MHDCLPSAKLADLEAQLIILGQAFGIERTALFAACNGFQHGAGKGAADPGGGQARAKPAAHHQLLVMRLHEFIAIMPADQGRAGDRHGPHRQLDEIEIVHQPVEQQQLVGMDQVFGIV